MLRQCRLEQQTEKKRGYDNFQVTAVINDNCVSIKNISYSVGSGEDDYFCVSFVVIRKRVAQCSVTYCALEVYCTVQVDIYFTYFYLLIYWQVVQRCGVC